LPRVGFLGLGTMGLAMARNVVLAGHPVLGWNRSQAPLLKFLEAGGEAAESAKDALSQSISFSMLANDNAHDVVLAAENLTAGTIHIGMASISPEKGRELSQRFLEAGAKYVSAPVLGRPNVAEAGELNILAGGDESAIAQALPLLEAMGSRIWNISSQPATANLVKIAVNYNILHAIQAIAESVALVERNGVSGKAFVELLTSTLFSSVVYKGYGAQIADREYQPVMFSMELGRKDLQLAMDSATESQLELPTASVLMELMNAAIADPELANQDWAAMAQITLKNNI
jgi:3-hydroxyisobutyrate dehydrogenase-like beta-hydroxyacid dehydrogenase